MMFDLNREADLTQLNGLTKTEQIVKLVSTDEKIFYLNRDVADQS